MRIQTTRFGEVEINDAAILTFPQGLYGFEQRRQFCLIDHRPDSPLKWLQSVEDPALAFVVMNPFEYFPDYEVLIPDDEAEELNLTDPSQAIVLTIVAVPSDPYQMTANLLAPLVINGDTRVARQIILSDERYSTKHRLLSEASQPASEVSAPCSS
jgi:flagellar assembly factor FliW